ncbi:hypothetical protein M434DRAFT_389432 [Hypoxylon sp. CO27-5]|nr:hypothetical protein M434DRAFT_389432 [Hypoxylon sp. CO27-5]
MSPHNSQPVEEEDHSTPVTSASATSTPSYLTYDYLTSDVSSQYPFPHYFSPPIRPLGADSNPLPIILAIPELRAPTPEPLTPASSSFAVPDWEILAPQHYTPTTSPLSLPEPVFGFVEVAEMAPSSGESAAPGLPHWPIYDYEATAPGPIAPVGPVASVIPAWGVYGNPDTDPGATISIPSSADIPVPQAPAPTDPFRQVSEDAFMGYSGMGDKDTGLAAGTSSSAMEELEWLEYLNLTYNDAVSDDMIRDLFPSLMEDPVELDE